ncbi:MAG: N-formylglutamate amidohydrolase [Pseudomonadota bacterium]
MRAPYEIIGPPGGDLLLIADHASNHIPAAMDNLGLAAHRHDQHIAYDIGTAALTRALSHRLGARAVLAGFSRLVIDPNRPLAHETLIPHVSDNVVIPGNAQLSKAARASRIACYYTPYHQAIAREVERACQCGRPPRLISIHSFTPHMNGAARPWHAAVLWNRDGRLAEALARALEAEGDLVVGRNAPYSGRDLNHSMDRHAEAKGLPYATLEIRQDLLEKPSDIEAWSARLSALLAHL